MEGGKLLATGSSSCIFRPNIPCQGQGHSVSNKKISKIIYGSKAETYFNRENEITSIVKNIKGSNKWAIIYDKFCQPPKYENIFKIDKGILDCKDKYYSNIFNDTSKMMISKYGGEIFEDYFINSTLINRKFKVFEKNMYILLTKMKYLFIGLKEMYLNSFVHLDIKINNIVLDGNNFKYIDFGLSGELHNYQHFINRSLSEFNTKRIYIWYPLEYLYAFIDKSGKMNELFKFNNSKNYRKHYNNGLDIYDIFNLNINNHIKELLNSQHQYSNHDYKEMVSMLDTYSLGILIPFLFVEYGLVDYIDKSKFLSDLFKLLKKMYKIDYKERIKPDECLKKYNKLIKKYSHLFSSTGKKTKKQKK